MKNVQDVYPLSPMQQGILFHTMCAPEAPPYIETFTWRIRGKLEIPRFRRSWEEAVARHTILRTAFIWGDLNEPLQVVRDHVVLPWDQPDWRGLAQSEQQERIEAFIKQERRRGFDVTKAPLMRCTLIHLAEDLYQFIWSYSHLLLDGWSVLPLMREVLDAYRGQDSPVNQARPYRDYIAWLQQQDTLKAEQFWRQTLKGFTTPTPLIANHAPENFLWQSERCSKEYFSLTPSMTEALRALARRNQLTLSTVIQSVWALLLSRYSSEHDVVFGITLSGRPTALVGVESMIGLFINTLPVRVRIRPDEPALSLLKEVQTSQFELRGYEYSPLVKIQQWSDTPAGVPLFQSILVIENMHGDSSFRTRIENIEFSDLLHDESRTNYPLTILVVPSSEISVSALYDADLFDKETVKRMLKHYGALLAAVVADPNCRVEDLPMLTPEELHQILFEWNQTAAAYPETACVHQMFEAQVADNPDAIAVAYARQYLSYGELERRANQLANYLIGLGVGADQVVGLSMKRRPGLVIGLLGVLKAGAAYLPLDASYPGPRLRYMLEKGGAQVLLSEAEEPEWVSGSGVRPINVEAEGEAIGRCSDQRPGRRASQANLCYVIYTSGSTGRPKGVMVTHEGVVNYLRWSQRAYGIEEGRGAPVHSAVGFDLTVTSLYTPLVAGKAVRLIEEEEGVEGLVKALREEGGYGLVKVTPAHLVMMEELMSEEEMRGGAGVLVIGGEELRAESLKRWREGAPGTRLINEYGPTETVVGCSVYEVKREDGGRGGVAIGRGIGNMRMYVEEKRGRLAGVGVKGEVSVGGVGVGRGYVGEAGETAARFVPDSYSGEAGARMYVTGDEGRWRADGEMEYLGRRDGQVKVRGYRVEKGEVEEAMKRCRGVKEAVVEVKGEGVEQKLVGYFVRERGAEVEWRRVREEMREELPEYMVPVRYVEMEEVPLTSNGKVDRGALPEPDKEMGGGGEERREAKTEMEEEVAGMWKEVLKVERVGMDDNFFDLGGNSLLMAQIYSRVRKRIKPELSIVQLFNYPTVETLAGFLVGNNDDAALSRSEEGAVERITEGKERLRVLINRR